MEHNKNDMAKEDTPKNEFEFFQSRLDAVERGQAQLATTSAEKFGEMKTRLDYLGGEVKTIAEKNAKDMSDLRALIESQYVSLSNVISKMDKRTEEVSDVFGLDGSKHSKEKARETFRWLGEFKDSRTETWADIRKAAIRYLTVSALVILTASVTMYVGNYLKFAQPIPVQRGGGE